MRDDAAPSVRRGTHFLSVFKRLTGICARGLSHHNSRCRAFCGNYYADVNQTMLFRVDQWTALIAEATFFLCCRELKIESMRLSGVRFCLLFSPSRPL